MSFPKLTIDNTAAVRQEAARWLAWLDDVERKTGHAIQGEVVTDGCSLEQARDAFKAGTTPEAYVAQLLACGTYRRARYRDERRLINAAGFQ